MPRCVAFLLTKKEEKMSGLKSVTLKSSLLLALAAFAFSATSVSAVDISSNTGSTEIKGAMSAVVSSPALKGVMSAKRDEVAAEKINAKPLINDLMPKIETVMMPVVKERILPEKMAGLQNEMAQKIAPKF